MTNEDLVCRYYEHGGEDILKKLWRKNEAYIISLAKSAAAKYSCLRYEQNAQLTDYSKTIIDDLKQEGALALICIIQKRVYDPGKAMLTTYITPYIQGVMYRWLERNIGNVSYPKDAMQSIRTVQRLYFRDNYTLADIWAATGVSPYEAQIMINTATHLYTIEDLLFLCSNSGITNPDAGDIVPALRIESVEHAVYMKICIELLGELFSFLPAKDRFILGSAYGVYGFEKKQLDEIALEHMMTVRGVEKAKKRALEKLQEMYPGSRLEYWVKINRYFRRFQNSVGHEYERRFMMDCDFCEDNLGNVSIMSDDA